MEVAEVVNAESLADYFRTLPPNVAMAIIHRVQYSGLFGSSLLNISNLTLSRAAVSSGLNPLAEFAYCAGIVVLASSGTHFLLSQTIQNIEQAQTRNLDKLAEEAFRTNEEDLAVSFLNPSLWSKDFHDFSAVRISIAAERSSDSKANWHHIRLLLTLLTADPYLSISEIPLQKLDMTTWEAVKVPLFEDELGKWPFWIEFYERLVAGNNIYAEEIAKVLNGIPSSDWLGDPAKVNILFDDVLALYQAEDAGHEGTSERPTNATQHVKAIRSQVSTLRDFLDVEYLNLSGHNARSPEQDDVLDLLRDLKALVDELMERLDGAEDEGRALVLVQENLPAVIEKAGELAIVEPEPQVSATTVTMAATIKLLVDSGADPKLATQIAMGDAATKKLLPIWRRILPWGRKPGDLP